MRFNYLVLVLSHVVDELAEIVGWKCLPGDDHDWCGDHQSDGSKIPGRIVLQVGILRRRCTMRSHVTQHDGVSICVCFLATRDSAVLEGRGSIVDAHEW